MLKHLIVDSTDFTQQCFLCMRLQLSGRSTQTLNLHHLLFLMNAASNTAGFLQLHTKIEHAHECTCPRHLSLRLSAYRCCRAPGEKRHLNCGARGITLGERTTMHCCAALPFCRYVPERCHLPDSAGKGKSWGHRLVKHKWSEQQLREVPSHKTHRFVAQE